MIDTGQAMIEDIASWKVDLLLGIMKDMGKDGADEGIDIELYRDLHGGTWLPNEAAFHAMARAGITVKQFLDDPFGMADKVGHLLVGVLHPNERGVPVPHTRADQRRRVVRGNRYKVVGK